MRIASLLASLVAASVLLENVPAVACSCSGTGVAAVWPQDGSAGVAIDSPLVVVATDLAHVTPALVAEDGTIMELRERRRLVPPGEFSCVKSSYAFLEAATSLAPNTRYVLTMHFDKEGDGVRTERVTFDETLSFVTGTTRRDPKAPELLLSLFGVPLRPQPGARGGTLLDVYVETDAVEPLFVVAQGERDVLVHDLDPLRTASPFRISFGSVECAALTAVDVTGTTLADRTLCEPSKCALVDAIGESTCGDERFPAVGWSTWESLPEGCDREALLQTVGGAGEAAGADVPSEVAPSDAQVASHATPDSAPGEQASTWEPPHGVGGCGLPTNSPQSGHFAFFGLLLTAMVRARALVRRM